MAHAICLLRGMLWLYLSHDKTVLSGPIYRPSAVVEVNAAWEP